MKILHINSVPYWGAGMCAIRINAALLKEGVESKMLFRDGMELPEGVAGGFAKRDDTWLDRHPMLRRCWRGANYFLPSMPTLCSRRVQLQKAIAKSGGKFVAHLPFSEYKNLADHPLVREADIIHLHWVPEFIDYPTFFKRVKQPIVWTLHDMHPVLGVMHLESEYIRRPQLLGEIDFFCKKIKMRAVKGSNIHPVAISQRMKDAIASSDILGRFPCELIHNGVEVNAFRRYEIPRRDEVTFLFSSCNLFDGNKGLLRLVSALELLGMPNMTLLCVGQNLDSQRLPKSRIKIRHLGFISDSELMSKIYSSADCFMSASYAESFAQTPLESMACGTPVVSTPCSGAADLIRDFNGVVCEGFTPAHLAAGIRTFLSRRYDPEVIRQHIVENYSYDKIARQYKSLYERILAL